MTLDQTGIPAAINDGGGRYEAARNKMLALDFATQEQQMKAIGDQPDYALGSVHAITGDGTLASPRSRAASSPPTPGAPPTSSCRWRAQTRAHPLQTPPADLPAQPQTRGRPRLRRLRANSSGGKILEIQQELPGRAHLVLISQPVGF